MGGCGCIPGMRGGGMGLGSLGLRWSDYVGIKKKTIIIVKIEIGESDNATKSQSLWNQWKIK